MPLLELKKSYFWQSLWYSENGLLMVLVECGRPMLGLRLPSSSLCVLQLSGVCFYPAEAAPPLCNSWRDRQLFWVLTVALKAIFSISGPQPWVCLKNQSLLISKDFFFPFSFLIQEAPPSLFLDFMVDSSSLNLVIYNTQIHPKLQNSDRVKYNLIIFIPWNFIDYF